MSRHHNNHQSQKILQFDLLVGRGELVSETTCCFRQMLGSLVAIVSREMIVNMEITRDLE